MSYYSKTQGDPASYYDNHAVLRCLLIEKEQKTLFPILQEYKVGTMIKVSPRRFDSCLALPCNPVMLPEGQSRICYKHNALEVATRFRPPGHGLDREDMSFIGFSTVDPNKIWCWPAPISLNEAAAFTMDTLNVNEPLLLVDVCLTERMHSPSSRIYSYCEPAIMAIFLQGEKVFCFAEPFIHGSLEIAHIPIENNGL